MLTRGDLVRLPQSCRLFSNSVESFRVKVLTEPKIAVILETDTVRSTVLMEESKWTVFNKDVQLCGVHSVR